MESNKDNSISTMKPDNEVENTSTDLKSNENLIQQILNILDYDHYYSLNEIELLYKNKYDDYIDYKKYGHNNLQSLMNSIEFVKETLFDDGVVHFMLIKEPEEERKEINTSDAKNDISVKNDKHLDQELADKPDEVEDIEKSDERQSYQEDASNNGNASNKSKSLEKEKESKDSKIVEDEKLNKEESENKSYSNVSCNSENSEKNKSQTQLKNEDGSLQSNGDSAEYINESSVENNDDNDDQNEENKKDYTSKNDQYQKDYNNNNDYKGEKDYNNSSYTQNRKYNSRPNYGENRNITCYNCGKTGHYKGNCTDPPKDNNYRSGRRFNQAESYNQKNRNNYDDYKNNNNNSNTNCNDESQNIKYLKLEKEILTLKLEIEKIKKVQLNSSYSHGRNQFERNYPRDMGYEVKNTSNFPYKRNDVERGYKPDSYQYENRNNYSQYNSGDNFAKNIRSYEDQNRRYPSQRENRGQNNDYNREDNQTWSNQRERTGSKTYDKFMSSRGRY